MSLEVCLIVQILCLVAASVLSIGRISDSCQLEIDYNRIVWLLRGIPSTAI